MKASDAATGISNFRYLWIPLAMLLVTIATLVLRAYDVRIDTVDTRVNGVQTQLTQHKDNTSIHRTAEEGRAWERGEQVWRELLMDRLQSIDKRLEKLEGRP
jgi:hypothetical protein